MNTNSPARDFDLTVQAAGLSGLAFALDCASVGLRVQVIDFAGDNLPDGFVADPHCTVSDWFESVARPLTDKGDPAFTTTREDRLKEHVRSRGEWHEISEGSVYGIPNFPLTANVINTVGMMSALRAYTDRFKPLLTIGKTASFGEMIDDRIGKRSRRILVDPLILFRYGLDPKDLPTAQILPGLNETVTRIGSLTGATLAYEERYRQLTDRVAPSISWEALHSFVLGRLRSFGSEIISEYPGEIFFSDEGYWDLDISGITVTSSAFVREAIQDPDAYRVCALAESRAEESATQFGAGKYFLRGESSAASGWSGLIEKTETGVVLTLKGPRQEEGTIPSESELRAVLSEFDPKGKFAPTDTFIEPVGPISRHSSDEDDSLLLPLVPGGDAFWMNIDTARRRAVQVRRALLSL